jgi:hypothetical protein
VTGRNVGGHSSATLATFLLARLDEDERIAADAAELFDGAQLQVADDVGAHIVRHDPARVLRDVAATRAVVQIWLDGIAGQLSQNRGEGLDLVDAAMSRLAAVYSDHPDYRPAWSATQDRGQPAVPRARDHHDDGYDDAGRPDNVVELRWPGRTSRP